MNVDTDVPLRTADGVTLYADVYRPDDSATHPALLIRTPYGRRESSAIHIFEPAEAIARGFGVVVQDVRGRYQSEGVWDPYEHEASDGARSVEWVAGLPWCNGAVGMYGASYQGAVQLAAASRRPAALRAIAPMMCWLHPDNGQTYRGGALELGKLVRWTLMTMGDRLRRREPDPVRADALAAAAQHDHDTLQERHYRQLPLGSLDVLRRHDPDSAVFRYIASADAGVLTLPHLASGGGRTVPALWIAGWFDAFLGDMLAEFARDRAAGLPSELVVGPWSHANRTRHVGELDFGPTAELVGTEQLPLATVVLDWFARTVPGPPPAMGARGPATAGPVPATVGPVPAAAGPPPVRLFRLGSNEWTAARRFPSGAGEDVELWLTAERRLAAGPGPDATVEYRYDPDDPAPTLGGAVLMGAAFPPGPHDQSALAARPDVVAFAGPVLGRDLLVEDWVSVELWVSSDAPQTDFVARLVDIAPDGTQMSVTDGILRCSPEKARPTRITVDLWATAYRFAAGHRIGLHVTSSSFPRWARNTNTGDPMLTGTRTRVAHQRIHVGSRYPSRLRTGRACG